MWHLVKSLLYILLIVLEDFIQVNRAKLLVSFGIIGQPDNT